MNILHWSHHCSLGSPNIARTKKLLNTDDLKCLALVKYIGKQLEYEKVNLTDVIL